MVDYGSLPVGVGEISWAGLGVFLGVVLVWAGSGSTVGLNMVSKMKSSRFEDICFCEKGIGPISDSVIENPSQNCEKGIQDDLLNANSATRTDNPFGQSG
nr:hypothetical protein [Tanacetum cinerariifolium]